MTEITEEQVMRLNASLPSAEKFFLDVPLYRSFSLEHVTKDSPECLVLLKIQFFDDAIKTLCLQCGDESVFRTDRLQNGELDRDYRQVHGVNLRDIEGSITVRTNLASMMRTGDNGKEYALKNKFFSVEFYCTKDHSHRLCFCFSMMEKKLTKIGQYPSISDLSSLSIKNYRQALGPVQSTEFVRAINLFSHDVGIGSFVYLRRIFEYFIGDAYKAAINSGKWVDQDFERKRMDEKIESLHEFLPEVLVENRAIYSILSKGIHELSEEQCLDYFPVVRAGIEMILEEKRLLLERDRKKKEIAAAIGNIKGSLE